jgi:hypothetical protein
LHAQEKEQAPSKTMKQPIGKPQKELQKTLIIEKEIKQEDNEDGNTSKLAKTRKKQGIYTN